MKSISVHSISKNYNKTQALYNVNFEVDQGELFGLIGADGAGKTSLMRILTTLILPDSGHAYVEGFDVVEDHRKIRNNIGYMPGKFSLYPDLSMEENLHFFATIFGTSIKENYEMIRPIYRQIEPFKKRRVGALSGGMKQKLALSCALIHRPAVLILDEPTTGVDAISRKEFWEMLVNLKTQGMTILVSTPYMDEASLCNRIALIHEGEILQVNTPQGIVENYKKRLYEIKSDNLFHLITLLRAHKNVKSCFSFGEFLHISLVDDGQEALDAILLYLKENDCRDIIIRAKHPSIEDCFIKLLHER